MAQKEIQQKKDKQIRITQYRYYGENHPLNFPDHMLEVGDGFKTLPTETMLAKYPSIMRLIITTLPGVFLNIHYSSKSIKYVIGPTGVLDLDLATLPIKLRGITIDPASMDILTDKNNNNYFILTIIYNAKMEEEEVME